MRPRSALLLTLVGLLLALPARSARAAGDDEVLAQAKAHFEAGRSAYLAGDYARAVSEFQAAQSLKPSPILDYNVGLAYEGLGDPQHAIEAYQRYLAAKPDAQNRADVEARIAALRAVAPAPPPVGDHAAQQQAAGTAPQAGSYDYYSNYPPPVPPPPRPRKSRWWIAPVVIGSVLVTVAIIVVVAAAAANTAQPTGYNETPPRALGVLPAAGGIPAQPPALLRF